jgi:Zn-dependent peptidase ImmA (M78 family)/transcriptional regulator with XRE-family HTH domain
MAGTRIAVSPATLTWARTTAGYDRATAARRLSVKEATVQKWESGDLAPTVAQLRNAAQLYGRPLAALFLPEPPPEPETPVTDFRRLDPDESASWSPALRAAIRRAIAQRNVLLELRDTAPDQVALGGEVIEIAPETAAETAGSTLRRLLDLDGMPTSLWGRPNDALNAVVAAAERLGVVVIQTQRVPLDEMRGFSIAEFPFPVAALNGSDWPRPKIFTLLHELAHVSLRASGLCDLHETQRRRGVADDIEHYCNRVAASALMPRDTFESFQRQLGGRDREWPLADLQALANRFGASSEAALLRLIDLSLASWDLYRDRKVELDQAYEEARREQKRRQRERETRGGPSFYVVKARDLGHAYVASVIDAFAARAISSRDVADFLDVRYDQLAKLSDVVRR